MKEGKIACVDKATLAVRVIKSEECWLLERETVSAGLHDTKVDHIPAKNVSDKAHMRTVVAFVNECIVKIRKAVFVAWVIGIGHFNNLERVCLTWKSTQDTCGRIDGEKHGRDVSCRICLSEN